MADEAAETESSDAAESEPAEPGLAARPAAELRKDLLVASGLFLFSFALFLLPAVLSRPLTEHAELRAALAAREMLRTGEYVTPRINGAAQLQNPPLQIWVTAGTAELLSASDGTSPRALTRAVQMPPAVFAALTVLLVTMFGCNVFGRTGGTIAGVIQSVCYLVVAYSQHGLADPLLMFFTAVALCAGAWLAAHPSPGFMCALALGVGLGLSLLTRAVFPAIVILIPLLIGVARSGSFRRIVFVLVGLAIAATLVVPWYAMLDQREAGNASKVLNTALANLSPSHPEPTSNRWLYYPYHLMGDLLPFTLLVIPAALIYLTRGRRAPAADAQRDLLARGSACFLGVAFVAGFIALYIGAFQRAHFLLPLLPALALFSGWLLSNFSAPGGMEEEKLAWSQAALGVVLALGLVSLPFWAASVFGGGSKGFLEMLQQPLTLPILIALAVGVILLFLYGARQWVEGRPAAAVAALGIVAYAGFAGWNIYNVPREKQSVPLAAEAMKLNDQLAQVGSDARVYSFEISELQAQLWLGKPALELRELAAEETGKTGAFAPNRVVLLPFDQTERLTERYGIAPSDLSPSPTGKLRLIPLSRDQDWPALLAQKQAK